MSTIQHKNQSFFGMLHRLLSASDPGIGFHVNIANLDPQLIKRIAYGCVILVGLYPAWLFRRKIIDKISTTSLLEYSILFTAIPLLSPLAWKAYFIFLWVPFLLVYRILFHLQIEIPYLKAYKIVFWVSAAMVIFSSEMFVGGYISDVMETMSFITIGTGLLLLIQLGIYNFSQTTSLDIADVNLHTHTKEPSG